MRGKLIQARWAAAWMGPPHHPRGCCAGGWLQIRPLSSGGKWDHPSVKSVPGNCWNRVKSSQVLSPCKSHWFKQKLEEDHHPIHIGFLAMQLWGHRRRTWWLLPLFLQSMEIFAGKFWQSLLPGSITPLCPVEAYSPPRSTEIHTPPSLRGGGSGLGGQNGWILSVVGATRIYDREALETRLKGGRGAPTDEDTHTNKN